MNKTNTLLALAMGITSLAQAQEFAGYRTSNYTGVNGVFFNPAHVAASAVKWDVNVLSLNAQVSNNNASFKLNDLNADKLEAQLWGNNSKPTNAVISANVLGPSFMMSLGKNNHIAVTTRFRAMGCITDADGKFIGALRDEMDNTTFPFTVSSDKNQRIALNGWTEFGASYGRELLQKGNHSLYAGVTLKYLGGISNNYTSINKINARVDKDLIAQDVYLSNTTGSIALGIGGMDMANLNASDAFKFKSSGLGFDLGAVYEFKGIPNHKLRVGAALLDLGTINYQKDQNKSGSYTLDITGSDKLYASQIQDSSIEGLNTYFKNHPEYFTPNASNNGSSYKVSLPTTLQVDVDFQLNKKFFVNAATHLSLTNSTDKPFNPAYYNGVVVTPRFETRIFSAALPVGYNQLSNFTSGLALRLGPVFLGSGSIVSSLIDESKQADFYFGIRFGARKK